MRGIAHRADYERHGREHVFCDRRGGGRRALRLKEAGMERVKAVIFDWAGTVIDYGSLAPMGAFVETFGEFGVSISIEEARGPMGMAKRPHIVAIMTLPRVAEAWTKRHGHAPTEADIDAVYAAFVPKNSRGRGALRESHPRRGGGRRRAQAQRRQDRLVDRLYSRDHGRDPAGRCVARISSPTVLSARATRLTDARRPSCFTRRS